MNTTQEYYDWVEHNAREIADAAYNGDENAKLIVTSYNLLCTYPEHVALTMLECGVDDYKKAHSIDV